MKIYNKVFATTLVLGALFAGQSSTFGFGEGGFGEQEYVCFHNFEYFGSVQAGTNGIAYNKCSTLHSYIPPGPEHHPNMTGFIPPADKHRVVHINRNGNNGQKETGNATPTIEHPHCIIDREPTFF